MKAKSLLLTVFVPVTGLTFLSLPGRVLDDVPSWVDGSSERDGEARRNRDSGTSRLT
jgi:hypothetical protein